MYIYEDHSKHYGYDLRIKKEKREDIKHDKFRSINL